MASHDNFIDAAAKAAKATGVLAPVARLVNELAAMVVETYENREKPGPLKLGIITIVVGVIESDDEVAPLGSAMLFSGNIPVGMAVQILEENARHCHTAVKVHHDGSPVE